MANEPENHSEAWLKAYAQKRREDAGAPLELHPVTRRLLLGEVARLRTPGGDTAGTARRSWLSFWPQIAFGLSILVALSVVVALLVPRQAERLQLAQQTEPASSDQGTFNRPQDYGVPAEKAQPSSAGKPPMLAGEPADKRGVLTPVLMEAAKEERESNAQTPTTRMPVAAPPPIIKKDSLARTEPSTVSSAILTDAAHSTPPAQPAPVAVEAEKHAAPAGAQSFYARADALEVKQKLLFRSAPSPSPMTGRDLGTAAPAAVPSRPKPSPTQSAAEVTEGARRERFREQDKAAAVAAPSTPQAPVATVLNSFELEHRGDRIQITDADGSVYEGPVTVGAQFGQPRGRTLTLNRAEDGNALQTESRPNAADYAAGPTTAGISLAFQATGTNRSLNQRVSITGQLIPSLSISGRAAPAIAGAKGAEELKLQQQRLANQTRTAQVVSGQPAQAALYKLQGKVRIGTNELPVDAVQVGIR